MAPEEDLQNIYRFFTEVGIINQLSSARLEAHLPGRMSATQFGLLGHLERRPDGRTPLQLAEAFQVPKTSMTHMLASLEGLGFVAISANPDDKRSKIARVTPRGTDFRKRTTASLSDELAPVLAHLTAKPFAEVLPRLEQIRIALDTDRESRQDGKRKASPKAPG